MSVKPFGISMTLIAGDPVFILTVIDPTTQSGSNWSCSWLNMGCIWCQECWSGAHYQRYSPFSTAIVCAMPFEMSVVTFVMAWWQDMSLPKGWDGKVGFPGALACRWTLIPLIDKHWGMVGHTFAGKILAVRMHFWLLYPLLMNNSTHGASHLWSLGLFSWSMSLLALMWTVFKQSEV